MKRVSGDQREYRRRVTARRFQRRLVSNAKRKLRSGGSLLHHGKFVRSKLANKPIRVLAPAQFFIGDRRYRGELLGLLRKLRAIALHNGGRVLVDFSQTQRMAPCGTLLFLATIDRIRRSLRGKKALTCNYPSDPIVAQVLQQVGIFDIFGRKRDVDEAQMDPTVRHWRFASGVAVEGQKLEPLLDSLEGRVVDTLAEGLFVGVTEAMTNCAHHAYISDQRTRSDIELRRWWMFSQEKDRHLSVAFCDLGIGIPRSLEESGQWSGTTIEAIINKLGFRSRTESKLIRASLELHKTRTGLAHRGKGLPQILRVVEGVSRGFLQIHSNGGSYRFNADKGTVELRDYRGSIGGTMILWNIPLPTAPADQTTGVTTQ